MNEDLPESTLKRSVACNLRIIKSKRDNSTLTVYLNFGK